MTGPDPGGAHDAAGNDTEGGRPRRTDRSPWNWLLVIPVVVPLLTPLYNYAKPTFIGIPLFYWLQMLFIVLGVGATTLVYQVAKRRR
ncbi:DUF3311 domain-containing protein [Actinocatenispora rupis]|uniref:DUF3311 domain-containing protein n=1 Tax=Actinocatenispora rupis TaxID=519421 RepID=UPI0019444967|nr:DUF3311 domain-containing protein [Actinocatenispora rupis]